LIGALAFLTIVGRGRRPDAKQQLWFPVVGAVIGALVGLVWWGASRWWALSRGLMVVAMNVLPYAREGDGVGTLFRGDHSTGRTVTVAITSVLLGAGGVMLGRGALAGAVCAAVAVVAGAAVLAFARRRIGGYTGDVLGAAGVILETVGLLALSARP
jgi:adenosylcobinamide-GDP ribazoletransferase